ncbi:hypothetical protein NDU88_004614 [Pleurodeles waltl]|uniref:Uncharacterized protein n=1 Tax=Pleurodeles waltl TaxID=8319 RepID=A0AAV7PFQ7_PLEWA|nr:hypothetical protein NDU88_004614 [Pleurodeles waltl]
MLEGPPPLTTLRGGQAAPAAPTAPQGPGRRCSPHLHPLWAAGPGRAPRRVPFLLREHCGPHSLPPLGPADQGLHCHRRWAEVRPAAHTIRRSKDPAQPPPTTMRVPADTAAPRQARSGVSPLQFSGRPTRLPGTALAILRSCLPSVEGREADQFFFDHVFYFLNHRNQRIL